MPTDTQATSIAETEVLTRRFPPRPHARSHSTYDRKNLHTRKLRHTPELYLTELRQEEARINSKLTQISRQISLSREEIKAAQADLDAYRVEMDEMDEMDKMDEVDGKILKHMVSEVETRKVLVAFLEKQLENVVGLRRAGLRLLMEVEVRAVFMVCVFGCYGNCCFGGLGSDKMGS